MAKKYLSARPKITFSFGARQAAIQYNLESACLPGNCAQGFRGSYFLGNQLEAFVRFGTMALKLAS